MKFGLLAILSITSIVAMEDLNHPPSGQHPSTSSQQFPGPVQPSTQNKSTQNNLNTDQQEYNGQYNLRQTIQQPQPYPYAPQEKNRKEIFPNAKSK